MSTIDPDYFFSQKTDEKREDHQTTLTCLLTLLYFNFGELVSNKNYSTVDRSKYKSEEHEKGPRRKKKKKLLY